MDTKVRVCVIGRFGKISIILVRNCIIRHSKQSVASRAKMPVHIFMMAQPATGTYSCTFMYTSYSIAGFG